VTAGKPSEFKFVLSTKTVPHGTVTFKYTNKGTIPHDFSICTKPTTKAANTCASKGHRGDFAGVVNDVQVHVRKSRHLRVHLQACRPRRGRHEGPDKGHLVRPVVTFHLEKTSGLTERPGNVVPQLPNHQDRRQELSQERQRAIAFKTVGHRQNR
jgi:hypothetical protein